MMCEHCAKSRVSGVETRWVNLLWWEGKFLNYCLSRLRGARNIHDSRICCRRCKSWQRTMHLDHMGSWYSLSLDDLLTLFWVGSKFMMKIRMLCHSKLCGVGKWIHWWQPAGGVDSKCCSFDQCRRPNNLEIWEIVGNLKSWKGRHAAGSWSPRWRSLGHALEPWMITRSTTTSWVSVHSQAKNWVSGFN